MTCMGTRESSVSILKLLKFINGQSPFIFVFLPSFKIVLSMMMVVTGLQQREINSVTSKAQKVQLIIHKQ